MEKIIAFFMAIITFFSSLFGGASSVKTYKRYVNLSYGTNEAQTVDIYLPSVAEDRASNGCILFIHGGAWIEGEKSQMESECREYAKKGYITATMDYRLIDGVNGVTVLDMLRDIDDCIKRIKLFSYEQGINIDKIALSGFSAGSHLSMLYAYANSNPNKSELLDFINPVIPVSFVAIGMGPASFKSEVWPGTFALDVVEILMGVNLYENVNNEMVYLTDETTRNAVIDLISPASHVTSNAVPSIFGYCTNDPVVPITNKDAIVNAFEAAGAKYDLVIYPNSGHGADADVDAAEVELYTKLFELYCKTYFGY